MLCVWYEINCLFLFQPNDGGKQTKSSGGNQESSEISKIFKKRVKKNVSVTVEQKFSYTEDGTHSTTSAGVEILF